MAVLRAKNLTKDYGNNRVIESITVQVNPGDKIGLVGNNGVGKTTLVELLTGDLYPDQGTVNISKGNRIGYLSQKPNIDSNNTLYEEMKLVFYETTKIESTKSPPQRYL